MCAMKRWQFWVGVAISLVFLYFVVRNINFGDFVSVLRQANYWWLIPGVAVYFVGVWVRAWRWHYLLNPIKSIPTRTMFPITAIGYMGNNIYPARAGEVLRAVVLKRKDDVPISASLATIIVERVFDGVVMLAFVFINLPELSKLTGGSGVVDGLEHPDRSPLGKRGVLRGAGASSCWRPCSPQTDDDRRWIASSTISSRKRYREKILGFAEQFLEGLQSLRSPQDVLMVFVTSVVIWLLETGKYWFVMHAFPFRVSFFALMLMNGIVNLATTIPSAPGYVGTFDAPGIAVLEAYGVNPSLAAGYTLVLHFALWVPITAPGRLLPGPGRHPVERRAAQSARAEA